MKMKKVLSIALAVVFAIGMLAGCNGGEQSELAKSYVDSDETLALTWLGYPTLAGCEEGTDTELLLEEKFNVEITPLFYEQAKFNDKKTMLMAGGDIPDFIYELDPVNVYNDVDQDFIAEVPYETIEQYAPTLYAYLNEYAPAAWSYSRYMDTNWGVPNVNHLNGISKTNAYRTDWLKAVGKEAPETLDEMHDVIYAFVHDDPDGNGKKDTYGYAMQSTHYQDFFSEFFGAYGILPFDWQEVDGEIVYGGLREECTEVLQIIADWYKEGLIHPDFVAGVTQETLVTTSQIGYIQKVAYQDESSATSQINTLRQAVPGAGYTYTLAPKGPDGLRGQRCWGLACHVASFGKTGEENVKVPRILKMFEGLFTDDALMTEVHIGKEGKHWEKTDASAGMYSYTMKDEYKEAAQQRLAGLEISFAAPSFFSPVTPHKDLFMEKMSDSYRTWLDSYTAEDAVLTDAFYKVEIIPSTADYLEDLRNKQMKLMADIIQGTKDASAYIPEFTKLWNNGGGDIMLEEAKAQGDVLNAMYKDLGVK